MHIEEQMQKAVSRFDWSSVAARLESVAPAELREYVENFLDVILRDRYLIVRRLNRHNRTKRDDFLEQLSCFLDDKGMIDLLNDRTSQLSSFRNTEEAYQEVLESLNTDLLM